jgi:hypothetical protein
MPTKSRLPFFDAFAQTKEMPNPRSNLAWLAGFLQPDERALVMAVLVDGQPIRLAARLMGQPYMSVRYRVRKLSRQLASRKCLAVARLMPYLSPVDATLAKLHYCSGHSCRRIGRMLGISHHDLRRRFDRIAVRIETVAQASKELEGPGIAFVDPADATHSHRRRPSRNAALAALGSPSPQYT